MTSSDSANQFLIQPDSDDKFVSYDIPLRTWLGDKPSDHRETPDDELPYFIQTTRFISDNSVHKTHDINPVPENTSSQPKAHHVSSQDILYTTPTITTSNPKIETNTADREVSEISHGFMFGAQSIPNLAIDSSLTTKDGDDSLYGDYDDLEDEGISEVYGWNNQRTLVVRQSDRSFKLSPESTPRLAISQRIHQVGTMGHHIGLGHRLGLFKEDKTLIPAKLKLTHDTINVSEDSPVQVELNWSKPNNASTFTSLVYHVDAAIPNNNNNKNIEVKHDTDTESTDLEWTQNIASTRWPTFRLYHTDDKLFIGKQRIQRRDKDLIIKLRVSCHGELSLPEGVRHWSVGGCSKSVDVIFEGYEAVVIQQTNL